MLLKHRKRFGYTQEQAASRTDPVVTEASRREIEAGILEGAFTLRCNGRDAKNRSPGLSKGTIAAVEQGRGAFLMTFQILALLYDVELEEIVDFEADGAEPDGPEPGPAIDADADIVRLPRGPLTQEELQVAIERAIHALVELLESYAKVH